MVAVCTLQGMSPRVWISVLSCGAALACASSPKPVAVAPEPEAPAAVVPEQSRPEPQGPDPVSDQEPDQLAEQDRAELSVDPNACNPFVAPVERKGGQLTVHAPPIDTQRPLGSRMRTHVDGGLSGTSPRVWVGPQVPGFVPLIEGTAELFVLDHQRDGSFLALYRDPYDVGSCGLSDAANCTYVVTAFAHCGEVLWSVDLAEHFSRPDHLEVQDLRLVDGTLYFNEACQSYAKDAGGKCSSLVALDPRGEQVQWRTKPLVSNSRFFVSGDYIVAGYGFTAERDTLHIVRRTDGQVLQTLRLPKAPEDIRLLEPGVIEVVTYGGKSIPFRLQDWDSTKPKLVKLADAP